MQRHFFYKKKFKEINKLYGLKLVTEFGEKKLELPFQFFWKASCELG